jgi:hypothetical protein
MTCVGALFPTAMVAQSGTKELQMTAEGIIDVMISGAGVRDLQFGAVTAGISKTVDVGSVSSAKWRFANLPNNNGNNNRFADLTFISLPPHLDGANGARLPVSGYVARVCLEKPLDSDYHCYGDYVVSPASPSIDPNLRINPTDNAGGPPTAPGGNAGRTLVVYLGATVTPAVDQPGGTYLGAVTLTFITAAS